MIKWRLLLTTTPFAAAALALKLLLDHQVSRGWLDFADVAPLLTVGAFLIGFMLAGTMADYKESEKLPADLACGLETLEDTITVAAAVKNLDARPLLDKLYAVTTAITAWLGRERPAADVYAAMSGLTEVARTLDAAGATPHAVRLTNELSGLRRSVTRVEVIAKTGFLESGYAILEALVVTIVALLMIAKFKTSASEYLMTPFITLVYVYMVRLIKDIDDPFEYDARLVRRASADVDPFPLVTYRDRAGARLARP